MIFFFSSQFFSSLDFVIWIGLCGWEVKYLLAIGEWRTKEIETRIWHLIYTSANKLRFKIFLGAVCDSHSHKYLSHTRLIYFYCENFSLKFIYLCDWRRDQRQSSSFPLAFTHEIHCWRIYRVQCSKKKFRWLIYTVWLRPREIFSIKFIYNIL
jgi:hypothetical protein